MLVHICCSVDSHYFLQELQKAYPSENLLGFFYNPNIHPREEYELRLQDVRRSCKMLNIKLIEGEYEVEQWLEGVKGLEDAPEKGERCNVCFDIRLLESARVARMLGERDFTTTLLSSPMKEQEILYSQGDEIAKTYNLNFIKINVRINGGVNRQNELAKKDNLYRQNYCGCQYALKQQRDKQGRISLEMLSSVGNQILPASNKHKELNFKKRDRLEQSGARYILRTQRELVWRLLSAKVICDGVVVPSYIIARSGGRFSDSGDSNSSGFGHGECVKKAKISEITWIKPHIHELYKMFYFHFQNLNQDSKEDFKEDSKVRLEEKIRHIHKKELEFEDDKNLMLGYSKRDDCVFMNIAMINFLLEKDYKSVVDMIAKPPMYESELELRNVLCGMESINPIIVMDTNVMARAGSEGSEGSEGSKYPGLDSEMGFKADSKEDSKNGFALNIYIHAIFQDENIFNVVQDTKEHTTQIIY